LPGKSLKKEAAHCAADCLALRRINRYERNAWHSEYDNLFVVTGRVMNARSALSPQIHSMVYATT